MGAFAAPIVGAVVSSALSDDGGSGGQTTSNEPWGPLQPYLQQLYQGAGQLPDYQPYYPGSTVAGQSPYTQLAQQTTANRAGTAGIFGQGMQPASDLTQSLLSQYNPSMFGWWDVAGGLGGPTQTYAGQSALNSLMPTAQGQMLNSNPYLDQMFQGAASQVTDQFRNATMPGLQSMFSAAGRYGPGAAMGSQVEMANEGLGNTLNRLASNVYGQNYANERAMQMQAAQQLGSLGIGDTEAMLRGLQGLQTSSQYDTQNLMQLLPTLMGGANWDVGQLAGLGQQQEAYNQQLINADLARWNWETQQSQYNPLQQFASLLGAIQTPNSSSMQYQPNTLSTLLGGANIGSSIYKNLFGGTGSEVNYGFGGMNTGLMGGTSGYGLDPFSSGMGLNSGGFDIGGGLGSSLYGF